MSLFRAKGFLWQYRLVKKCNEAILMANTVENVLLP